MRTARNSRPTAIRACVDESGIDCPRSARSSSAAYCRPALARHLQAGGDQGRHSLDAGCTTLNKVCGSGMKATMLGNDLIRVGSATS